MTPQQDFTYYRAHLATIAPGLAFRYRPTNSTMPFELQYEPNDTFISVRILPISDHADRLHCYSHHIRLEALRPEEEEAGTRFIPVDVHCGRLHHAQTIRVPLSVACLNIVARSDTVARIQPDAQHPPSAPQQNSACIDWHPPQVLAIVQAGQQHAFSVPAFGKLPVELNIIKERHDADGDNIHETVSFGLSIANNVQVSVSDLRLQIEDRDGNQSECMPFFDQHPIDDHLQRLLEAPTRRFVLQSMRPLEVVHGPLMRVLNQWPLFGRRFEQLLDNRRHPKDLLLLVGPQSHPVPVYRALLASQSPVLRQKLIDAARAAGNIAANILVLPHDRPDVWHAYARFSFTGCVDGPLLIELLAFASRYGMRQLAHAAAMGIVAAMDFLGGEWRPLVAAVVTLHESDALRGLLRSACAQSAHELRWRMIEGAERNGAAAPLCMRNVFGQLFDELQQQPQFDETEAISFCVDGREFRVHRFILAVLLPDFMLRLNDVVQQRVPCRAQEMELLLKHIYCGAMLSDADDTLRVWRVAMHFGQHALAFEAETRTMMGFAMHGRRAGDVAATAAQMVCSMMVGHFVEELVDFDAGQVSEAVKERTEWEVKQRGESAEEVAIDGEASTSWEEDMCR